MATNEKYMIHVKHFAGRISGEGQKVSKQNLFISQISHIYFRPIKYTYKFSKNLQKKIIKTL